MIGRKAASLAIALLSALTGAARAEIAVSANDGKQIFPGDTISGPQPDSIAVLAISDGKVRVIGSVSAPASMIGPPAAVALSKDGRFALVSSCQSLKGRTLIPNDVVSVVDLSHADHPRVVETAHAGPGASGLSISPDGRLALVANTEDSTITVFSIRGEHITRVGRVELPPASRTTDVVFTPDGKTAIAVAQSADRLVLLSVHGTVVKQTGKFLSPGRKPYGAVVTLDG